MGTTTIRLSEAEEALLDLLAPEHGGRSGVIHHALNNLAAERARQEAFHEFLQEWEAEAGPCDEQAVATMAKRYGL